MVERHLWTKNPQLFFIRKIFAELFQKVKRCFLNFSKKIYVDFLSTNDAPPYSWFVDFLSTIHRQGLNGGASFQWSFGPHSAWGSIESTAILTTYPSLLDFVDMHHNRPVLTKNQIQFGTARSKPVSSKKNCHSKRSFLESKWQFQTLRRKNHHFRLGCFQAISQVKLKSN